MADEGAELRSSIGRLDSAIGDLKIAVAELKVTVQNISDRDREDRLAMQATTRDHEERISGLERWRSRVNGQLALLGVLAGGSAVAILGRVMHLLP